MNETPLTDWNALPLVLEISDLARIFRCSVKSIRRELHADPPTGRIPPPLPKAGTTAPYQWSRFEVEQCWKNGSRQPVVTPGRRRFFGKARSAA